MLQYRLQGHADQKLHTPQVVELLPTLLFVGILTAPQNLLLRTGHREGWLQSLPAGVIVKFFVAYDEDTGRQLLVERELSQYKDIIQVPTKEGYRAVANKTAAILSYGATTAKSRFVLKLDDDSAIDVQQILAELQKVSEQELYWGHFSCWAAPIRQSESSWFMSQQEFPREVYPPFAHGAGYVVSQAVAMRIAQRSAEGTLPILALEDVSVGWWVEEAVNKGLIEVHLKHDERFQHSAGCSGTLMQHRVQPTTQVCLGMKPRPSIYCECWNKGSARYEQAALRLHQALVRQLSVEVVDVCNKESSPNRLCDMDVAEALDVWATKPSLIPSGALNH